jgi:hypothetical protein
MLPSISVRIGSFGRNTSMPGAEPVKLAETDGQKGSEAALWCWVEAGLARVIHEFYKTFTDEPLWASATGYTRAGAFENGRLLRASERESREGVERYDTTFEVELGP